VSFTEVFTSAEDGSALEAAMARVGRSEIDAVMEHALDPRIPARVLFAALERFTALAQSGAQLCRAGDGAPEAGLAARNPQHAPDPNQQQAGMAPDPEGSTSPGDAAQARGQK
jgi:hypothetical protein